MKNGDLYDILGVSRTAGQEDIKEAFRKKAKEMHPDAISEGQDKVAAEDKFKVLSNAYHVLSDQERRMKYDAESSGRFFFVHNQGFDPRYNANIWRHKPAPRTTEKNFTVDIMEFHGRSQFDCRLLIKSVCTKCGGVGYSETTCRCRHCEKMGASPFCLACGGSGVERKRCRCEECHGSGGVEKMESFTLDKGDRGGSKYFFKIEKGGNYDPIAGGKGDLYILIEPVENAFFKLIPDSADVETTINISLYTAFFGGKVQVRTLEGTAHMSIPRKTPDGAVFRLPRMGLRTGYGSVRGNQIIHVRVVMPELSGDSLAAFKNILSSASYPGVDNCVESSADQTGAEGGFDGRKDE